MTWFLVGVVGGWLLAIVTVKLYVIGKLNEVWHVKTKMVADGYEIHLRKGSVSQLIYRVKFDRPSSANPDHTFGEQMAQARTDAFAKAADMNVNERLIREHNRKNDLPGGIV